MSTSKTHLPSAVVLVVSLCGILLSLALAAVLAAAGLFNLLTQPDDGQIAYMSIAFAWENGLVALLLLPAALFSLWKLLEKSPLLPGLPRWAGANTALLFWPALLGAGYLAAGWTGLSWLLLPPLQLLAIGIPIWWLVSFAGRGLEKGPSSTRWKLFSVSVLAGNPLIFVVELAVIAALAVGWIAGQPEFISLISGMTRDIEAAGITPEAVEPLVGTLFAYPGLVSALILGAAVAAPVTEELLKTAGVWLLFGKELTPARGLAAGAVCGAAFALVESLGVITQPFEGQAWAAVMVGRLGTAVMHIFTASLTGWGIASLASGRKFGRTLLGYAAAAGFHGLWNYLVIVTALQPYLDFSLPHNRFYELPAALGLSLTASLAVLYLLGLYLMNRRLRAAAVQPLDNEVK